MLVHCAMLIFLTQTPRMPPTVSSASRNIELDAKLRMKVHDYHLQAHTFVEALTITASKFGVPIGIQWVNIAGPTSAVDLSWKDTTAYEILRTIVDTQPGLDMRIDKGVVHVLYPRLIPDRENPVELKIGAFRVNNVPAELASQKLRDIVKALTSPPESKSGYSGGVGGTGFSNIDDPKITINLANARVEDVLDALVLTSARKIWIVTFVNSGVLTRSGLRRTRTLWNDLTLPDEEQPLWDFLHWGDKFPYSQLETSR
jgi:hypothetical protein